MSTCFACEQRQRDKSLSERGRGREREKKVREGTEARKIFNTTNKIKFVVLNGWKIFYYLLL